MATPRIIKKYPNRRLYDTESSRYITLEDLTAAIKGGAEAKVIDAKSGADLTQECRIAEREHTALDTSTHTEAGDRLEFLRARQREVASPVAARERADRSGRQRRARRVPPISITTLPS